MFLLIFIFKFKLFTITNEKAAVSWKSNIRVKVNTFISAKHLLIEIEKIQICNVSVVEI